MVTKKRGMPPLPTAFSRWCVAERSASRIYVTSSESRQSGTDRLIVSNDGANTTAARMSLDLMSRLDDAL